MKAFESGLGFSKTYSLTLHRAVFSINWSKFYFLSEDSICGRTPVCLAQADQAPLRRLLITASNSSPRVLALTDVYIGRISLGLWLMRTCSLIKVF